MPVLTIVRKDLGPSPVEQIVGCDLSEGRAQALVDWGRAEWGPDVELPPAVYLLRDLEIDGFRHPSGTMLQVGGEVTPAQALLLIRGGHAGRSAEFPEDVRAADCGAVVSTPGGGIG